MQDIRWRPAPTWLAAGLVAGPACGAVVATLMLVVMSLLAGESLAVGSALTVGYFGAFFGGIIGIVVGFLMTFAVGSHLPDQQARERAFLVCFCSAGLPAFAVLGIFFAFHPLALAAAFLSAVAGGALSYWLAPLVR